MHTLSEQDILNIWESGLRQRPVERAISVVTLAAPPSTRAEALAMSIGERDTRLLAIRESLFGVSFAGFAACQQCQENLEFSFEAIDMRPPDPNQACDGQPFRFRCDGYEVQARLPNSTDLLAIAGCQDVATARARLLERCITSATYQECSIEVSKLPDRVIEALGEAILERDPQAEVRLELVCSSCGHRWFATFDILPFLWQELTSRARHTLREVHMLASAYGWSERDILAMSGLRRRMYLEMVSA